jgi:hypothetical protein
MFISSAATSKVPTIDSQPLREEHTMSNVNTSSAFRRLLADRVAGQDLRIGARFTGTASRLRRAEGLAPRRLRIEGTG